MDSDHILTLTRLYAQHHGYTVATVSTYIAGSGDTFARLERGHTITLRRAAELIQKFSDHWPTDQEWPADIPRPPVTPPESEEAPAGDEAAPVGADGQVEEPVA